jgi:capsular exopolysaccharide synthesis family protein
MELLRLYSMLLRRKWLVIQAVVFFTVAAGVLAMVLPKNYRSQARVIVNSSDTTMSILSDLGLSEVAAGLSSDSDNIQNTIQMATTRPVLEDIIWRLQLRDDDGRPYTTEELLVPGLFGEFEARPNVSIVQQQGADILIFEAVAGDPGLARLLADTHVKVAILGSQDRARQDTRGARIFIEDQLKVVETEFDDAMRERADAQSSEAVVDLESEMKAGIGRMSELILAMEQNAANIQEVRARIGEQLAYQGRESAALVSPITQQVNQRVATQRELISQLRAKRATELTVKTAKHPDVLNIDKQLDAADVELAAAISEQHALDPSLHDLRSQLVGLTRKGAEIKAAIDRSTEEFRSYPDKLRRFSQLELTADAAESVFQSLQEQRYQIGVAESMLVSDLQLIEPAPLPERHFSPKLLVNLIMGLGLGGIFGLGLAFTFEYVDDTVKRMEDLERVWPVLRLGIVPRFTLEGESRTITSLEATHPICESYRTIRNGMLYASLDKPLKVVGITSALPGEGKSTFSINLATSFAREGKRVLLVDCDLRRPVQHRQFPGTSNHRGLTDVLTRKVDVAEAIQATPHENLSLLTSGATPTDPARMIESLRLRQLLLDLAKQFDMVIVDTPPAMVVNDSMVIARAVDGMVVVVESNKTSVKVVADLRQRFESSGIEPLGLVLNKMDYRVSGYGHYAKAYEKYHKDVESPSLKSGGGRA